MPSKDYSNESLFGVCPRCGREIVTQNNFCPECGTRVDSNNAVVNQRPLSREMMAAIGLIAGLILTVMVVLYIRHRDDGLGTSNPEPTTAPAPLTQVLGEKGGTQNRSGRANVIYGILILAAGICVGRIFANRRQETASLAAHNLPQPHQTPASFLRAQRSDQSSAPISHSSQNTRFSRRSSQYHGHTRVMQTPAESPPKPAQHGKNTTKLRDKLPTYSFEECYNRAAPEGTAAKIPGVSKLTVVDFKDPETVAKNPEAVEPLVANHGGLLMVFEFDALDNPLAYLAPSLELKGEWRTTQANSWSAYFDCSPVSVLHLKKAAIVKQRGDEYILHEKGLFA